MVTNPTATREIVIDVTGLPADVARLIESFVLGLRSAVGHPFGNPRPTDEEFDRALRELASGTPVPTLPADWSRADLYDDHD